MADWLQHILGLSAHPYYGNSIADWAVAGFVAVAAWLGLSIMRRAGSQSGLIRNAAARFLKLGAEHLEA